jgi:hypothetical protein
MFPRTIEVEDDPRVRETTAMLGPLAATLLHKPGAQYGYLAGREAYRNITQHYPDFSGYLPLQQLRGLMDDYLARPRHRPRRFTRHQAPEWRAMFLLGWSEGVMNETNILKDAPEGEGAIALEERRQRFS